MAIIFLSFNLNLLKVDTLEATDVIDLSDGQRDKNNQIFNIFEKKRFRTNHCNNCYSGIINSKMSNLYRKRGAGVNCSNRNSSTHDWLTLLEISTARHKKMKCLNPVNPFVLYTDCTWPK